LLLPFGCNHQGRLGENSLRYAELRLSGMSLGCYQLTSVI
jgi:hypothetical protein